MLSALYQRYLSPDLFLLHAMAELLHLILSQRYYDMRDLLIARENAKSVNENGRAIEFKELLAGRAFARRRHAGAESGCRDNDCDLHQGQKVYNFGACGVPGPWKK